MNNKLMISVVVAVSCAVFLMVNRVYALEKVAFVDLVSVFDEYEKTKKYDVKLEGEQKAKQDQIDKKVEEIKALQSKMSLLSEKEKENKQAEIEAKTKELQEFQRESEMELLKNRDERLKEILEDIQKVVEDVAKKEKYDLILNEQRALLYGDESMDISDTILKQLNDTYKK